MYLYAVLIMPSPLSQLSLGVPSSLTSSLTRRIQRVRSTSLENGSELYYRILKPMDQVLSHFLPAHNYYCYFFIFFVIVVKWRS